MRVVVVPSWYPSEDQPVAGIFIRDQVEALAARHDVVVLVPRVRRFRQVLSPHAGTSVEQRDDYVQISASARPRSRSSRSRLGAYVRAATRAWSHMERTLGRPDVIHAHVVLPAGWFAAGIGRRFGVPIVLTEHSSPFDMHLRTAASRARVASALARTTVVTAVGPVLADQIHRFGYEKDIVIVENLLPSRRLPDVKGGAASARIRVGFVGLLTPMKGAEYLLRALARVVRSGQDIELLVVGDGPLRPTLEALATRLGLQDRCQFVGTLDRQDVYRVLVSCDILVSSSLHESFAVNVIEALGCGVPVVATRSGGPDAYLPEPFGILVPPADVDQLADGLTRMLARLPELNREEIAAWARNRFGEKAFLDRLDEIYEQATTS